MRFARKFVSLVALFSIAVVPLVSVGCGEEQSTKTTSVEKAKGDADKKPAGKPAKPKAPKKSSEAGSTTGTGTTPPVK